MVYDVIIRANVGLEKPKLKFAARHRVECLLQFYLYLYSTVTPPPSYLS